MFNRYPTIGAAVCVALFAGYAQAAPAPTAFGADYQPVAPVAENQAQVVYYRTLQSADPTGSAHIYVDREFHTGLLPNGYSSFCVQPGTHTLGSYLNDAPLYQGKQSEVFKADLQGGKTYFLRVNAFNTPEPVTRKQAEEELAGSRMQVHALSRASSIEKCNYVPQKVYKDYNLSGDVLFAFGKSEFQDITRSGHAAISRLISELQRDHAQPKAIEIVGHTDPIGKDDANYALGLRRALTVRQLLIDGGMPANILTAHSAGSSQPVEQFCYGSRAEQVACNAPNRRVQVRVDVTPDAE